MPAPAPEGEARPPERRGSPGGLVLALVLTFASGAVDAIGFLAFGGVFVSFMSGNSTRLGVALAQGAGTKAMLFASVVVLFVAGAAAAHGLGVAAGRWRRAAVLLLTAFLLLMATATGRLGWSAAALILTAPAMGALSTASAHAEGVSVTPTYVTGMLMRLGVALADWALGRGGLAVAVLLPTWAAMVAGAGAGAWGYARWGLSSLAAPAALTCLLAALVTLSTALRRSRSEP